MYIGYIWVSFDDGQIYTLFTHTYVYISMDTCREIFRNNYKRNQCDKLNVNLRTDFKR